MDTAGIIKEFNQFYTKYKKSATTSEPSAMSLATADADGRPSCRIVLLKAVDERGFVFYTNFTSNKGEQLQQNPFAALTFFWHEIGRQIRVEGRVEKVSDEEADAYFASREKKSQIGAWASKQSSEIEGRLDFEKRIAKYAAKYALSAVPRPPFWGGFRVIPDKVEFWVKKDFRLHERTVWTRGLDDNWTSKRIYP